jgi:hypothetical protein
MPSVGQDRCVSDLSDPDHLENFGYAVGVKYYKGGLGWS